MSDNKREACPLDQEMPESRPMEAGRPHSNRPASGPGEAVVGLPVVRNTGVVFGVQMNMEPLQGLRKTALTLCVCGVTGAEVLPPLGPTQECPRRAFYLVEQISTETRYAQQ
jgi:hypothetical protein